MKTRSGVGADTMRDVAIGDTAVASDADVRASAPLVGAATGATGQPSRGDTVGRFVVLGVLGSGGMGVVYSAYDPHLDRKVAIKLLGSGGAKQHDATVRLLREAQAMAKINHPNVIKVHEVGTHGDQVFIAMEFADAGTIRGWLKQAPRSRQAILDVFVAAGRGLAAAHGAGLVHRDFKPDNVLMSMDGSIRVTDFGLVSVSDEVPLRAATQPPVPDDRELGDDTPLSRDLTRTGSIMGTPTYMAPEQFSGGATTSQTDQFAFCVALHEALYGERPFAGTSYQELSSSVLSGEVLTAPQGARVPVWIRRALLRGLSTDPAKRYSSMKDLLSELASEPARRKRKLILAGALACAGATAIVIVALWPDTRTECRAGADRFAVVWNADQRARIRSTFDATHRPHAAASFERFTRLVDDWGRGWQHDYTDACEDTRVRAEQSEHLLDLRMQCLTRRLDDTKATLELLAAGGPDVADKALSAALALPSVATCNDAAGLTAAVAPPETEIMRDHVAGVRAMLDGAQAKRRLGRYAAGLEAARAALVAARASRYQPVIGEALLVTGMLESDVADKGSIATLRDAMHTSAAAGDTVGMIDASAWLTHTLTQTTDQYAVAAEIGQLGEAVAQHARPPPETIVRLDGAIAALDAKRGKLKEARSRYERALALADKELGPDHPGTMMALNQLGNLAKQEGRFADARMHLEQVVARRERLFGKEHPEVASAINNLGRVYRAEGNLADAKKLYERALAIRIAALGPDHPEVGASLNSLGAFYGDAGDQAQARVHFEKALAVWEKTYGKDHIEITAALGNLAGTVAALGDRAGARALYERARAIIVAAKGPDHPDVAIALSNLGNVALDERSLDEALELYQRALQIAEKAYGPEHPDVADYLANLTAVYSKQGKFREAKDLSSRTLVVMGKAYGADHPHTGGALINHAVVQVRLEDHAGALETFRRSLAIFEGKLGPDHPYVAYALNGIGGALVELGKHAEAVPNLERALAIRVATSQPPDDVAQVHHNLALALVASPRTRARAIEEAKQAIALYEKLGDTDAVREIKTWLANRGAR